MSLMEYVLDPAVMREAYRRHHELATRASDPPETYADWTEAYTSAVRAQCCQRCLAAWKSEGDYLCPTCRGMGEVSEAIPECVPHPAVDPEAKEDAARRSELNEILGRPHPDDYNELQFFAIWDEVEAHPTLAHDNPAHRAAQEVLLLLEASPSFRQALLPRILQHGPGVLTDWRFIWNHLITEQSETDERLKSRTENWRRESQLRETRRWRQLRHWLLERFTQHTNESDETCCSIEHREAEPRAQQRSIAHKGTTERAPMSHFEGLRAKALGNDDTSGEAAPRWVEPNDLVEVLWTDGTDEPHLATGRFKGLRIPGNETGGPVQFIIEGSEGEVDLNAEELVGITPVTPAAS